MKNLKAKINNSTTKIIILFLFAFMFKAHSQDRDQKFSVAMLSSVNGTYNNGFNLGASLDYQMDLTYFKAQLFMLPQLNGLSYKEISAVPVGFNYHSFWNEYRIYAGLKLGFTHVISPEALIGVESGLDISINKNMYLGLMASLDYSEESKALPTQQTDYLRFSGFLKIGFRF